MRQYSPDLIEATWAVLGFAAVDMKEGFARGTFLQPTQAVPTWTQMPNGVGGVVRMFDPNSSGTLTVLVDQESRLHQILITIHNADRIVRSAVGPIVVRDGNTREVTFYNKAYIITIPDIPKGSGPGIVGWPFHYESKRQQPFAFDANAVGV